MSLPANMNILHIFNEYLPKTEVWAYELIRHCPEVNHYVIADYYANVEDFEQGVHLLNRKKGLLRKKRAQASQYDFPRNLFQPLFVLSDTMSSSDSIGKLIGKHKIDIVHIHFGTTAIERWDELKTLQVKIVISFYGWDYAKAIYYNPSYKKTYRDIFEKAHLLITEGSAGRERLIDLGAEDSKIKSLALGVSSSKEISTKTFKSDSTLRLVQVASFSEKKGQLLTIQAFQKAREKHSTPSSIQLTLVGDNRDIYYAQEVKQCVIDQNLSDSISILDWIDFEKLDSILKGFDVFIHPSQYAADGDCEGGAPVILLHAQANGLPIISTTHCDIPEQVIHSRTGILTDEGNVEALTDAILEFAEMSADQYTTMSQQAIEHITQQFNIIDTGKRLFAYYSDLNDLI